MDNNDWRTIPWQQMTYSLLPADSKLKQYIDGLSTTKDVNGFHQQWLNQNPTPPPPADTDEYSYDPGAVGIADVAIADLNTPTKNYDNISYKPESNPNALDPNDYRVRKLKERQEQWQKQLAQPNQGGLKTINPSDPNADPRVKAAAERGDRRTYDSYYKSLNVDYSKPGAKPKPWTPNWKDDWYGTNNPTTSALMMRKNGGTLQQDYRGWEKEMYDSYKCGGKTKKKSCGGTMSGKKKACGGMKVKK